MKKIIYIANSRIPTTRAHGIQIMKTCEALAEQGVDVELVLPTRINKIKEDAFEYYSIRNNFKISYLKTIDLIKYGRLGVYLQTIIFSIKILLSYRKVDAIFYSRDILPVFLLSLFSSKKCFFEAHNAPINFINRIMVRSIHGVVTVNNGLSEYYRDIGVKNISVVPNGVDVDQFNIPESREEARRRVNLLPHEKIIMYLGSFSSYSWKGLDIFLNAAKKMPDLSFVAVGGTRNDILRLKEIGVSDNVILIEYQQNNIIPLFLRSADVLILPNRSNDETSSKYTSPIKLFQYLASGTPIVASRLPSITEIISEENSVLVLPDSEDSLVDGVQHLLDNNILYKELSEKALFLSEKYSWDKRAERLLDFFYK